MKPLSPADGLVSRLINTRTQSFINEGKSLVSLNVEDRVSIGGNSNRSTEFIKSGLEKYILNSSTL